MSHSPAEATANPADAYTQGWEALFQLLYEGGSLSGRERNCCYLNTGNQTFTDVSAAVGFNYQDDGRAIGLTDWDQDGRLDVWMVNRTAPRARFLRNVCADENHFLQLRLQGTTSNRDAIGARVRVEVERADGEADAELVLIDTVRAGMGYLSQSSKTLHFGLGKDRVAKRAVVSWPTGVEESFEVSNDGRYLLVEGSGEAAVLATSSSAVDLQPTPTDASPDTDQARIVLAGRLPLINLDFEGFDGARRTWTPGVCEKPTLLNVWASWCQPCVEELTELASDAELLDSIQLVALSVDEPNAKTTAKQVFRDLGLPTETSGFAIDSSIELLDTVQRSLLNKKRQLPVPASFLIDTRGRIAAIYKGKIELDQLRADVRLAAAGDEESWSAAVPFPGWWFEKPNAYAHSLIATSAALTKLQRTKDSATYLAMLTENLDPTSLAAGAEARKTVAGEQVNLAAAMYQRGEVEMAYDLLQNSLKFAPDFSKAHFNLGIIERTRGQFDAAAASFRRATQKKGARPEAHFNLGEMLAEQDPQAAISHFAAAVAERGDFIAAIYNLGLCQLKTGQWNEARAHFDRVVSLNDGHADALYQLGNVSIRERAYDAAIGFFERAIQSDTRHTGARTNLAALLLATQKVAAAIPHLEFVARAKPQDAAALSNLGTALLATGKVDEAIGRLRRATQLDDNYSTAKVKLATALIAKGSESELAEAADLVSRVANVSIDAKSPEAWWVLAQCRERQSQPQAALVAARQGVAAAQQHGNSAVLTRCQAIVKRLAGE